LGVWRSEIDEWLKERRIRWREDATNADHTHTRNRIRREILPMMAKALGREVKPAIWRAAELLGAEEDWIDALIEPAVSAAGAELGVKTLRGEPLAKQRRLLRAWLERGGVGAGFAEVEAVRSLLDPDGQGRPAKVNLPGDRHARRRGWLLWIEPAAK
jgi:tRNA(Ile)-lysidine synthase